MWLIDWRTKSTDFAMVLEPTCRPVTVEASALALQVEYELVLVLEMAWPIRTIERRLTTVNHGAWV